MGKVFLPGQKAVDEPVDGAPEVDLSAEVFPRDAEDRQGR
jgi:hypothetical protein